MLQDFLVPEMRATKARLDGVDKRFDGVDRRIDELKASIEQKFEGLEKRFDRLDRQFVEERTVTLNAIENMMKKLTLRIDLTIIEGTLAEYEAKTISKESHQ